MNASRVILLAWLLLSTQVDGALASQTPGDFEHVEREIELRIDGGHFGEAESLARNLLTSVEESGVASASEVARAGDQLVTTLVLNGRGAQASTRALAERLVRQREAGGETSRLADALRNLGDVLAQSGDYRAAVLQFDRARQLRERAIPPADLAVSKDLERLASALVQTDRNEEALQTVNGVFEADQRGPEPSKHRDERIARALEIRGLIWQRKGDYPRARVDLDRALAVREETRPGHPDLGRTLALMGLQLLLEGDLLAARSTLERAMSVARATLRPEHPDIAAALRLLAIPVGELGDLAQARTLLEQAVAIAESSLGYDHQVTADCVHDLAGTVATQGDYEAARTLFERALGSYERRLGPGYRGIATVFHNLSTLNAKLGDFQRARSFHQRAVEAWTRTLGPSHPFVASALSEFGRTLADQRLYAEAQRLFEQALAIRERALGPDHPNVAETLSALADTLGHLGQPRRALGLSQRALDIWSRSKTPDVYGSALSLLVHGAVLTASGDPEHAIEAFDRALSIQRPILGASHPDIARAEVDRASLAVQMNRREEALAEALRAEEVGRNHLRLMLSSLPGRQALDYAAARPQGLSLALSLLPAANADSRVLNSVIRGRSLVLDEEASRIRASTDTRGRVAPLRVTLTSARQRLANLMLRGPTEQQPAQYARLVNEASLLKDQTERALALESATFRSELSRSEIDLDGVRAHLSAGTALVSFVRFDRTVFGPTNLASESDRPRIQRVGVRLEPSYLAFVLRPDLQEPTVVTLGAAEPIDALIARWRQQMLVDIRTAPSDMRSSPSFRALGTSLRRKIWDPVAQHLGDARRVFVVPDGALNVVPLAALPTSNGRYLLDDGPVIHYLPAERDLVSDENSLTAAGKGLLSIGDPSFNATSPFVALAKKPSPLPSSSASTTASSPVDRRTRSVSCLTVRSMQFGALPASRAEAQVVAELWQRYAGVPNSAGRTLIGANATEHAFKEMGPGARVLHIATHGFFLNDDCAIGVEGTRSVGGLVSLASKSASGSRNTPAAQRRKVLPENPLLYSGLALAGANRRASAGLDEDDGVLTAEEVAALDLQSVEWAVLSACDTGLDTLAVGEGVLGLRRAFQIAGARTVIMSLWSVEDRAARQWMEALYRARLERRLDTADSVRAAALSVLNDRRAKGQSTHPFYWGAFVAAGDWR